MVGEFMLSALMVLMVAFVFLMKQGNSTTLSECSSTRCTIRGNRMVFTDCSEGCLTPHGVSFYPSFEVQDCLPVCEVNSFQVVSTTSCQGASLACTDGTEAYTVKYECKIADGIGFTTCSLGDTRSQNIPCERTGVPPCGLLIVGGSTPCKEFDPYFESTTMSQNYTEYGVDSVVSYSATCSTGICSSSTCDKTVKLVGVPNDLGVASVHQHLFGVLTHFLLDNGKYLTAHPNGTLSEQSSLIPAGEFVIIQYVPGVPYLNGQFVAVNVAGRPAFNFQMDHSKDLYVSGYSGAFAMA